MSLTQIPYKRYRVQKQPELIEFLKTRTLDIPEGTPRIFVHVMKVLFTHLHIILLYNINSLHFLDYCSKKNILNMHPEDIIVLMLTIIKFKFCHNANYN